MGKYNLVLASASPRRKEIFENHGINPIIIPSLDPEILPDELKVTGLSAEKQEKVDRGAVEYLAMAKAKSVAKEILRSCVSMEYFDDNRIDDSVEGLKAKYNHGFNSTNPREKVPEGVLVRDARETAIRKAVKLLKNEGSLIILGADTLVFKGEKFGKPQNPEDAFRMLKILQGSSHKVITGVAVLFLESGDMESRYQHFGVMGEGSSSKHWRSHIFSCETVVRFKKVSDEIILDYVATEEPYDKAGGYAIQGYFGKFVEGFDGDYENVIGLPFKMIEEYLQRHF